MVRVRVRGRGRGRVGVIACERRQDEGDVEGRDRQAVAHVGHDVHLGQGWG